MSTIIDLCKLLQLSHDLALLTTHQCICTSNIQYYRDLKQRLLKYNGDNDWVDQLLTSSGINDQEKLCRFLTR